MRHLLAPAPPPLPLSVSRRVDSFFERYTIKADNDMLLRHCCWPYRLTDSY